MHNMKKRIAFCFFIFGIIITVIWIVCFQNSLNKEHNDKDINTSWVITQYGDNVRSTDDVFYHRGKFKWINYYRWGLQ